MKADKKIKQKKQKVVKKPKVKTKKEKVLIVAQEIKFARLLSGNEKKTRDRVLKSFKKWLLNCFSKNYEFKEEDFMRVWKGLFYAMWMSDKPLVQEDLCEAIAGILDLFSVEQLKPALLMTKAGFKALATEWYGIDHHRMDKFLMLVRRWLRGSLRTLRRCEWRTADCRLYADMLADKDGILATKTPLYARNASSMLLHVVDCFLEELAKVSSGNIPSASVYELLVPMCRYVVGGEADSLCVATRRLLTALLRQSDQGLEYQHKTKAWEKMGCPRGGPDALELVSDDEGSDPEGEDEDEILVNGSEKPLDPRAGRVDVELSTIPVPASSLAKLLRQLLTTAGSKAHKRTKICLERFEQLTSNEYPLKVKDVFNEEPPTRVSRATAARQLRDLERSLVKSADELALRGLSRKHRKKLLAKSRAGLSIVEDVSNVRPMRDTATNGNWEVESTETASKKRQTQNTVDSSNKENVNRTKNTTKRKHADAKINTQSKRMKPDTKSMSKVADKKKSFEKPTRNRQIKTVETKLMSSKHSPENNDSKKKVEPKLDVKTKLNESAHCKVVNKNDKKTEVKANALKAAKEVKKNNKTKKINHNNTEEKLQKVCKPQNSSPKLLVKKVKNYQKKTADQKLSFETPKKVKFVLKNNSMQKPVDYYKSVRQSPSIPFDSTKKPTKTNLKPSTPSPINPFFKKKLRLK